MDIEKYILFGFQFPHHGSYSAFSAMKREMKGEVKVLDVTPPAFFWKLPKSGRIINYWRQVSEVVLKPYFQSKGSNLIHYYFPENTLFRGGQWKGDAKLVLTLHQPNCCEKYLKADKRGLLSGMKSADAIVLMASHEIDEYRNNFPNAKVLCIPYGVDTEYFKPVQMRKKPSETVKVFTAGNWLRDYSLWAKVVNICSEKGLDIEFSVLANSETLSLAKQYLDANLQNIRFLSEISDDELRMEYAESDLIFLPLTDAWANTALMEASSMGRPIMVSDLPSTREYLGDEGIYFRNDSANEVAEILISQIGKRKILQKKGEKLRRRMVERFRWQVIAEKYLELYAKM